MPPAELRDVLVHFSDFGLPDCFSDEPVIAWRGWELDMAQPGYPVLNSVTQRAVHWPARQPLIAECRAFHTRNKCAGAPRLACSCGIYGLLDGSYYTDSAWFHRRPTLQVPRWRVYGRVSLWGYVVKHVTGFRASTAYPYELTLPEDLESVASLVVQKYGVDVTLRKRETVS